VHFFRSTINIPQNLFSLLGRRIGGVIDLMSRSFTEETKRNREYRELDVFHDCWW